MNFQEYQIAIEKFCIYPNIGPSGIVYPVFGLMGEIGEAFLDDDGYPLETVDTFELGDVYFYMARTMEHLGIDYMPKPIPGRNDLDDMIVFLVKLSHELNELLKKWMRDNNELKADLAKKCLKNMADILFEIAYMHGVTPEYVMLMNCNKLNSRLERGAIKGDGDNR